MKVQIRKDGVSSGQTRDYGFDTTMKVGRFFNPVNISYHINYEDQKESYIQLVYETIAGNRYLILYTTGKVTSDIESGDPIYNVMKRVAKRRLDVEKTTPKWNDFNID